MNMFRSAYVNNIYGKRNTKRLKEIAKDMRTSLYAMTTHYNKFFNNDEGKDIIKKLREKYNKIPDINIENKDKFNIDVNEYSREYYKNNRDKVNEMAKQYYEKNKEDIRIRRNNICDEEREKIRRQYYLRKLNKNKDSMKPKKKTLDKYNIFFNDDTNEYEIRK